MERELKCEQSRPREGWQWEEPLGQLCNIIFFVSLHIRKYQTQASHEKDSAKTSFTACHGEVAAQDSERPCPGWVMAEGPREQRLSSLRVAEREFR
jgi:hypothetical protein